MKLVREGAQISGRSPHQTSASPLLHFYIPPHAHSNGTRQPVYAPIRVCIFARTEHGNRFTLLHKCASSPERNAAPGLHSYTRRCVGFTLLNPYFSGRRRRTIFYFLCFYTIEKYIFHGAAGENFAILCIFVL